MVRFLRKKNLSPVGDIPYKRLAPNHIRVLKLKPSTPEWPIRVKLLTIDLLTTKYTTLSYTGELDPQGSDTDYDKELDPSVNGSVYSGSSAETTHTILCDKSPVQVSQCLWDVLQQLRNINSDAPIFIDELSINFASREERAMHMGMMGIIHSKASHIVVCLGNKTEGSDDTVLAMRRIVNSLDWRRIPPNFNWDLRDPKLYKLLGINRISVRQWKNIYDFCSARWFSRVWSFHELVMAQQVVFLLGDIYMDYQFLHDFAMVLSLSGWLDGPSGFITPDSSLDEVSLPLLKMLNPVAAIRAIPSWHPHHPNHTAWMHNTYNLITAPERAWKFFEIILQTCEGFTVQDPRDRVFAPLSLMRALFADNKAINNLWPIVDYGTSTATVYGHFISMIQQHTRAPSILATANIHHQPRLTANWTESAKLASQLKEMQNDPKVVGKVMRGKDRKVVLRQQQPGQRFSTTLAVTSE